MVNLIYLAAGNSRRFGSNKLLLPIAGKPMYRHGLSILMELQQESAEICRLVVVTSHEEIRKELCEEPLCLVWNEKSREGISTSIRCGLDALEKQEPSWYFFFVADQPYLRKETLVGFLRNFFQSGKPIGCISYNGNPGNPVIFSTHFFDELYGLSGDSGGKQIVNRWSEQCFFYEARDSRELMDIDYKEDLNKKIHFIGDDLVTTL